MILVLLTVGGCKGIENVRVIVLLTATPVAVSTGSEDDISKAGTLDANLYARLYHVTLHETHLKINTSNILC